jgi:UDP-N-acetylglucosamine--N-acetylmuramyl-(pentapeptide) pyrophosphoryl-undecaprenol N-acetylglucosamine transferase
MAMSPNKPLILVFGGSQGAKAINDTFVEIIKRKLNTNYQIMWATGQAQYDIIKQELANDDIDIDTLSGIKVVPYIYNMEEMMNLASIVVCRSGAMTVTEIARLGKAAIFIPLPNVSENHQEYNARVLEKMGAARVILNSDLTADVINDNINSILSSRENLEQMGINAKMIDISNVEDKIYDEIVKLYT